MKEHPEYKGIFVCPDGEIYSNRRGKLRKLNPYKRGCKEKYDNVYLCIDVQSRPSRKCISVHRLVAETYLPNPNNFPVVHHVDENKFNNNVSNLEWTTQQKNCEYSRCQTHLIVNEKTGIIYQIRSIRKFAEEHNLDFSSLAKVISGKRKSCGGFVLK